MNLYKVKVSTDIMVYVDNSTKAIKIAKQYASDEIAHESTGFAEIVNRLSDVPNDWQNIIPYSDRKDVKRTCKDIIEEINISNQKELIELVGSTDKNKETKKNKEKFPETKLDPKTRELEWQKTTESRQSLPSLRFIK